MWTKFALSCINSLLLIGASADGNPFSQKLPDCRRSYQKIQKADEYKAILCPMFRCNLMLCTLIGFDRNFFLNVPEMRKDFSLSGSHTTKCMDSTTSFFLMTGALTKVSLNLSHGLTQACDVMLQSDLLIKFDEYRHCLPQGL